MVRRWFHIAKAEFYVLTAGLRKHRKAFTTLLYAIALFWAVYIAPIVIGGFIDLIMPMAELRILLIVIFPGLMRSIMLFLWAMLLLFPISYALQEIKIGQWEIFLSNDVKTRDMLVGTFLGKIPLYGLVVILLAPILISPFMIAFEVSLIGQGLIYLTLALMVLSTIWLSNWVTAIIQARLGDSPRGNDIAKALSMLVAVIVIVPMYGIMFMLPAVSDILGMNGFLVLPSTWTADLVSWLAITFNGIGLTGSQIVGFQSILQLDMLANALLMGAIGVFGLVAALTTADRIFTISAGVRTEIITTVGKENLFLRGLRRISPDSTGVLLVTNLKDYLRKAQNLSKLAYGVILAVMMPIIMSQFEYMQSVTEMLLFLTIMMSIVGSLPFAGTGFLESKDQLWIIQSAPSGPSRFVRTRLVSSFLIVLPVSLIPVLVISFLIQASISEFLLIMTIGYLAICGGVLVSTGITARNPNYEDTKSPAHQANMVMSVMIPQFSMMIWLFVDIFVGLALGIGPFGLLETIFVGIHPMVILAFQGVLFLLFIGSVLVLSGIRSLSKPEV